MHRPRRIIDPFAGYLEYLRQSNQLVGKVYELDKDHGFADKGTAAAFDFTTHRLAAGSQMLLDLWYSAWLDSATYSDPYSVPPPPPAP